MYRTCFQDNMQWQHLSPKIVWKEWWSWTYSTFFDFWHFSFQYPILAWGIWYIELFKNSMAFTRVVKISRNVFSPIIETKIFNICKRLIFDQNLIDLEFGKHFKSIMKKVKGYITWIIIMDTTKYWAPLKEGFDIHSLTFICTRSKRLVVQVNAWDKNGRRCFFQKIRLSHKGYWICNFLGLKDK